MQVRLAAPGEHRGGFGTCGRRARGPTSPYQDPRPTPRAGNSRPGGGKRCTDSATPHVAGNTSRANHRHPAPPAPSRGIRLGPLGAARDSNNCPAREWILAPNRDPAQARRRPSRPPGRTGQSAQPAPGPADNVRKEHTRGPMTQTDARPQGGPLGRYTRTWVLARQGRTRKVTVPKEAVTDSVYRWRSPANHGPPPPGRRTMRCKDSPTGQPTGPPSQAAPT
jgi:hypothetical protein